MTDQNRNEEIPNIEIPTSWFPLPDVLVELLGIKCAAVYGAVWFYAKHDGSCNVQNNMIAAKSGVPKTTIQRCLMVLVATGFLTVERISDVPLTSFHKATHIYRLTDKLVFDISDEELGISHSDL